MATQTGSIDLTASNSVKLMAEAGFESVEENYYTKAELDVTVQGINTEVSKKVNGTEIISTINQSAESVSINASKINLTGAVTISDLSSDAQSATLNSNINVGGRNLLRFTVSPTYQGIYTNWTSGSDPLGWYAYRTEAIVEVTDYGLKIQAGGSSNDGFVIPLTKELESDAEYTLSFDYRGTNTGTGDLYVLCRTTPNIKINGKALNGTGEWSHFEEVLSWSGFGSKKPYALLLPYRNNSSGWLEIRNGSLKLERGNKATDWTPAPEDVDSAISDAAETATSYVTEITGQNGIMVHPSTDDDTGVRITSDVDILRNGYNVINVGTQGDTSGNTDAGVTIYDGTTNENVVATFDADGIGLVGGAFRLTSERVTEEYGDENNPTTMTEIRSTMKSEGSNDDFETRCFLRSMVGDDADAYYNSIELTSETDIKTQSPTETNNASVEVGSDQWGSSVRLVADSQELHLYKHPVDGKDYFNLNSEVFMITDYHNGVCVWSTAPGTVLWSSGGWHMAANHTANLAYNVSTCPTGIVLHFQPYTSSTTQNYNHIYYFVPKEHVASYNGTGVVVQLGNPNFSNMASKYLYISNDHITGHANNTATGTSSGITYNNAAWVMTQVIAV